MSGLKTLFRTSLTDSQTSAIDTLGDVRQEHFKRYKYVKFITATVVAGDVVKYETRTKYDASEVEPSTTTAVPAAGVVLATQAINDFGWIQISGITDNLTIDITNTPLVGSMVQGSATTKAFRQHNAEGQNAGVIMDTTGSAMRVLLSCPD